MKKKLCVTLVSVIFVLCAPVLCNATLITADASLYPQYTDISNVFNGVTLSGNGGSHIYSFGSNGWYTDDSYNYANYDSTLVANFTNPTNFVSLTFDGDDPYNPIFLKAYDSSDTLLVSLIGNTIGYNGEELSFLSTGWNISYIVANHPDQGVAIRDLTFDVPEPSSMLLVFTGIAGLLGSNCIRQRKYYQQRAIKQ